MRIGDSIFFEKAKDGGPKSRVDGYWIVRIKWLFTVALLRFGPGSREAFHSHAFNSVSWLLSGRLVETFGELPSNVYTPSWRPILTFRSTTHKVYGEAPSSWVLTFRGPWASSWHEVDESGDKVTLTHNRVELSRAPGGAS